VVVRRLAAAVVLTAAAGLLLAGSASAKTKTKTAHLGAVRATVTWTPVQFMQAKNVRLRIARSGRNVLDRRLGLSAPLRIRIKDLDGDDDPEVLVDLYTGGAHCCEFSLIYRYTGNSYSSLKHIWGDLTYHLNDLDHDGVLELVSGDDRFAYSFTAYAGSAFPIQIWNYQAGKLRNVTRSYPAQIKQDSARLWKEHLQQRTGDFPDPRGILAAWMADEDLLGLQAQGWAKMQALNRKGEFKGIGGDDLWPKNGAYLAKLRKFLKNHGYA